jgi:plastocyanin
LAVVNAFHVIGALFALWAVTLAVVGITRENFPGTGVGAVAVGAVSVLLAVSAIGSGIVTGALEDENEEEAGQPATQQPGGRTLRLSAATGSELRFDRRSLEAHAGEVEIVMDNPSALPHNVSIEGDGVSEEGTTVGKGGTSTVRAKLRPGKYTFYCSVSGHRQGGMEGTLTVR